MGGKGSNYVSNRKILFLFETETATGNITEEKIRRNSRTTSKETIQSKCGGLNRIQSRCGGLKRMAPIGLYS